MVADPPLRFPCKDANAARACAQLLRSEHRIKVIEVDGSTVVLPGGGGEYFADRVFCIARDAGLTGKIRPGQPSLKPAA